MKPGTLMKIDGLAGFKLGAAVFPYMQTPAAQALINITLPPENRDPE